MIKPSSPFRAVVAGSAYPRQFTTDDEFEPDSEAAAAALALDCLSDDDKATVEKAQAAAKKAAEAEAKKEAKAQAAAPENKTGGDDD